MTVDGQRCLRRRYFGPTVRVDALYSRRESNADIPVMRGNVAQVVVVVGESSDRAERPRKQTRAVLPEKERRLGPNSGADGSETDLGESVFVGGGAGQAESANPLGYWPRWASRGCQSRGRTAGVKNGSLMIALWRGRESNRGLKWCMRAAVLPNS